MVNRSNFRELGFFGGGCAVVSWIAGAIFVAGAVVAIANWQVAPDLDMHHFDAQLAERLAYLDAMGRVSVAVSAMITAVVVWFFSRLAVVLVRIANRPRLIEIEYQGVGPDRA